MNRVKQDGRWLTQVQNKAYMAERFKKEHGIILDEAQEPVPLQKVPVVPTEPEAPIPEPEPEPETPTPPESVPEVVPTEPEAPVPDVPPATVNTVAAAPTPAPVNDMGAIRAEYEEVLGKKLSFRYMHNAEWMKGKIDDCKKEKALAGLQPSE